MNSTQKELSALLKTFMRLKNDGGGQFLGAITFCTKKKQ